MADKSGIGSLILNILVVGAVALVTFQASSEQPGTQVVAPLWSPSGAGGSKIQVPGGGAENPGIPVTTSPAIPAAPVVLGLPQIVGTLSAYLANLDGELTNEELRKINQDVGVGWKGQIDGFMEPVAAKIRSGQGESLAKQALDDLGKSSYDTKVKVMAWIADSLRTQGWTWENIQKATGRWTQDVLKLDSVDFWGALKKD